MITNIQKITMKKPTPSLLTVLKSVQISPNMQRITLQGESLAHFPDNCEGSYIKLIFTQTGDTDLSRIKENERPVMRTYTIKHFSLLQRTIDVDFVRHTTDDCRCGFAARWAMHAKTGDIINIAGPGSISSLNVNADWFFTVADMTALPALSTKLRTLPDDAKGYAVIKVIEHADIQTLETPKGIEVIWLVNNDTLTPKIKSLPWLTGTASVWVACEFDTMRELRDYFRNEKKVAKENIYISSYWKKGVTEDGHKVIKQQDSNEAG